MRADPFAFPGSLFQRIQPVSRGQGLLFLSDLRVRVVQDKDATFQAVVRRNVIEWVQGSIRRVLMVELCLLLFVPARKGNRVIFRGEV